MIIGICLTILLVLTLVSVVFGEDFATGVLSSEIDSTTLINGSSTTIEWAGDDVLFTIDPIQGAIVVLIGLIVVVSIISIQVLASGLSSSGSKAVSSFIFFIGVWFMLSTLAEPLIRSVEIFGGLLYLSLTILYLIGVGQKVAGGGDE